MPLVGDCEDVLPTYENTKFTMDSAKTESWADAQTEIEFLRLRLCELCGKEEGDPAFEDDVMDFIFGRVKYTTHVLQRHVQLGDLEL
jgi:hypothetical protein